MKKPALFFLSLFFFFDVHAECDALAQKIRRVDAHLLIGDAAAACQEGAEVQAAFPHHPESFEAYIRALARSGREREMVQLWNAYVSTFPSSAESNRALPEAMAWGAIFKGENSSSPIVRLSAMLAAFFGQDAKSVELLSRHCSDCNSALRGVAVQLCGQWHDTALVSKILEMVHTDRCWKVRLEAIKAIGTMEIKKGKPLLLSLLVSEKSSQEEKAAAIKSLILLIDDISREEIERLAYSNRVVLRLLAAEAIGYLQSKRDGDVLLHLSADYHCDVRAASLHAIGLFNHEPAAVPSKIDLAISKLQDPSPEVSITAAWMLALNAPELARVPFEYWLNHAEPELRQLAAAALAATGQRGSALMRCFFQTCRDPFVKMNLAIGLIQHQTDLVAAATALKEGLTAESGRWMWGEDSSFRVLMPSTHRYEDSIAADPEAINQITRLEILNLLAITRSPMAEEAIKNFLKQKKWGISAMAATLLLCEGDETALAIVHQLLHDPDTRIRLQAALVLSLWEKDEEIISLLQAHYAACDREMKERILESLGRIGSSASIAFLIDKLQEPQQVLRIIAAGSLLQCLYH